MGDERDGLGPVLLAFVALRNATIGTEAAGSTVLSDLAGSAIGTLLESPKRGRSTA